MNGRQIKVLLGRSKRGRGRVEDVCVERVRGEGDFQ